MVIRPDLLKLILDSYSLPLGGSHGLLHWARVLENGRRLAPLTGADPVVVELFAVFHDARRENEGFDPEHGDRGGKLARILLAEYEGIDDARLDLLGEACRLHTRGLREADVTTQTCWDADRLDLLRVGIRPAPDLLCTDAARTFDMMEWANTRARNWAHAALIREEWGIELRG